MGWLDGALRIMPSWEFMGLGHTIPFEVLLPAVVFPGLIFTICFAWPMIERRYTGDNELHNLLDRPRDRPKRTAAGVAMFALLFTLFAASSTDVLANFFKVSLNATLWFFRIAVIVVPIIAGLVAYQLCKEMQGVHGIGKRKRAVIVRRSAEGEYSTVPAGTAARRRAHRARSRSRCRSVSTLSRSPTAAPACPRARRPACARSRAERHRAGPTGPPPATCGSPPRPSTPSSTSHRAVATRCVTRACAASGRGTSRQERHPSAGSAPGPSPPPSSTSTPPWWPRRSRPAGTWWHQRRCAGCAPLRRQTPSARCAARTRARRWLPRCPCCAEPRWRRTAPDGCWPAPTGRCGPGSRRPSAPAAWARPGRQRPLCASTEATGTWPRS